MQVCSFSPVGGLLVSETLPFDVPTCLMPALNPADEAAADRPPWNSAVASSLTEAERLLDQSERQGYCERMLVVYRPKLFLVRWR
jgi:hypothetical protein